MQIQAAVSPELNHRLYIEIGLGCCQVCEVGTHNGVASVCFGSTPICHLIKALEDDFLHHVSKAFVIKHTDPEAQIWIVCLCQ